MKKPGICLALALLAQVAVADDPAPEFANLAGLVVQSGVSISLLAEQTTVEEPVSKTLDQQVQEANRKLDREIEDRIMSEIYSFAAE